MNASYNWVDMFDFSLVHVLRTTITRVRVDFGSFYSVYCRRPTSSQAPNEKQHLKKDL